MRRLAVLMLVVVIALVSLGVYLARRTAGMPLLRARHALEVSVGVMPEPYLKRVYGEAIAFLKEHDRLTTPYFIGGIVYANASEIVPHVLWLENGFETVGFCVTYQRNGESFTIRLPILDGVDYRSQVNRDDTALREYEFGMMPGDYWGMRPGSRGPDNAIADVRSFQHPVMFSVYDRQGKESNRVEMYIFPRAEPFLAVRFDANEPEREEHPGY